MVHSHFTIKALINTEELSKLPAAVEELNYRSKLKLMEMIDVNPY